MIDISIDSEWRETDFQVQGIAHTRCSKGTKLHCIHSVPSEPVTVFSDTKQTTFAAKSVSGPSVRLARPNEISLPKALSMSILPKVYSFLISNHFFWILPCQEHPNSWASKNKNLYCSRKFRNWFNKWIVRISCMAGPELFLHIKKKKLLTLVIIRCGRLCLYHFIIKWWKTRKNKERGKYK